LDNAGPSASEKGAGFKELGFEEQSLKIVDIAREPLLAPDDTID
jgi:hypothetical protein